MVLECPHQSQLLVSLILRTHAQLGHDRKETSDLMLSFDRLQLICERDPWRLILRGSMVSYAFETTILLASNKASLAAGCWHALRHAHMHTPLASSVTSETSFCGLIAPWVAKIWSGRDPGEVQGWRSFLRRRPERKWLHHC